MEIRSFEGPRILRRYTALSTNFTRSYLTSRVRNILYQTYVNNFASTASEYSPEQNVHIQKESIHQEAFWVARGGEKGRTVDFAQFLLAGNRAAWRNFHLLRCMSTVLLYCTVVRAPYAFVCLLALTEAFLTVLLARTSILPDDKCFPRIRCCGPSGGVERRYKHTHALFMSTCVGSTSSLSY